MIRILVLAVALVLLFPAVAAADPISGLIAAVSTAIKGSAILTGIAQAAGSFALSFLSKQLMGKPKQPGQQIDAPTNGDAASETIVLGRRAVSGHFVYHGSHGQSGKTPNAYYQRVYQLCGMPGARVRALIMEGRYVRFEDPIADAEVTTTDDAEGTPAFDGTDGANRNPFGGTPAGDDTDYGLAAINPQFTKDDKRYFWLKWWDGSQTAADAQLVASYAGAENPWQSTAVGSGLVYAVVTWRFDRKIWQRGTPDLRFIMEGIPLYDPRNDSSVGGDGAHRWGQPETYEYSENLAVIIYNIARGIGLPNGATYGGAYPDAHQLPVDTWAAAMNVCDEQITTDENETRRRYTGGMEVKVAEDVPATVMEELAAGCSGKFAPRGDKLFFHVGEPEVPVLAFTDDDISATDQQKFDPILPLSERVNAVSVTHFDPRVLWEPSNLPEITDADWQAEDGGARSIGVQFGVVFNHGQSEQLGREYLADARKERTHQIALPPEYGRLRCLQTIGWTSELNQYDAKLFEVESVEPRPDDLFVVVTLRERDPDDYDHGSDTPLVPPVVPVLPTPVQAVPGFSVTALILPDAQGNPRRPAFLVAWAADQADDVVSLRWQMRLAGETDLAGSGVANVEDGQVVVSEAVLPAENYELRAQLVADRATEWTDWVAVTAPDVRIGELDIVASLRGEIAAGFALTAGVPGRIRDTLDELRALSAELQDLAGFEAAARDQLRVSLSAEVEGARAEYTQEINVLADEALALSQELVTLSAELGDNSADITNLAATRVTAAGAVAAVDIEVGAGFNGISGLASITAGVEATLDGVSSALLFRVDGGFINLVSFDDGVSGPTVTAEIAADYIRIRGISQLDTAVIEDLAASTAFIDELISNTAFIDDLTVRNVQSANYAESGGVPTAGIKIDGDTGEIKAVSVISTDALSPNTVTQIRDDTINYSGSAASWTTIASVQFPPEATGNFIEVFLYLEIDPTTASDVGVRFTRSGSTINGGGVVTFPKSAFAPPGDTFFTWYDAPDTVSRTIRVQVIRGGGSMDITGKLTVRETKR